MSFMYVTTGYSDPDYFVEGQIASTIANVASISAAVNRIFSIASTNNMAASIVAVAQKVLIAEGIITNTTSISVVAMRLFDLASTNECSSNVTTLLNAIFACSANLNNTSSILASMRLKWEDEADTPESWSNLTVGSETWTNQTTPSETWIEVD